MHDPTWRSGKNISRHVGSAEFRAKSLFFFVRFFFCFRLVFLVLVVFFVSLYSVSFFTFIYFLPYCLIPFHPTSCHSPEVLREVLRFTYF